MTEAAAAPARSKITKAVLLAVPILFWIAQEIHPFGPPPPAHRGLALLFMMAFWWMTETLPIHWVALLPLVVAPFFPFFPSIEKSGPGFFSRIVANTVQVAPTYYNSFILIFMGGMLIGVAIEEHNLHRRIALNIMKAIGSSPRRILLGFVIATSFISLWISNTATAVMMVPIAIAVISQLEAREGGKLPFLGQSIMLAIAYGANVGGIGTIIGTAPNMQFAGYMAVQYKTQVTFLDYLVVGLPFVLLFLPITFFVLAWLSRKEKTRIVESDVLDLEIKKLGPMSRQEKIVAGVFLLTSSLWILNEPLRSALNLKDHIKGDQSDAMAALLAPLLLFLTGTLRWGSLKRMPWDVLILLGGSYALAEVVRGSGLSVWLGGLVRPAAAWHPFLLMLVVTTVTVFLSAFTANAAASQLMMTLVTGIVDPRSVNPGKATPYLYGVTVAASCDFALPCGTPPNAIVFGTRYVKMRTMAATGVFLDLAAAVLAATWIWFGARHLLRTG
jgi:sodium-dependent dicarboxylate transporter 2/3/5